MHGIGMGVFAVEYPSLPLFIFHFIVSHAFLFFIESFYYFLFIKSFFFFEK